MAQQQTLFKTDEQAEPARVACPVKLLVSCIADIENNFILTGERTPANGICYVNKEHDCCATIYQGEKARLFFNRRDGFEGRELWPVFFKNEIVFYI